MVDIIVRRYKNGDASAICEIIKKDILTENIKDYVALNQLRHDDKIFVEIDVDENCYNYKISFCLKNTILPPAEYEKMSSYTSCKYHHTSIFETFASEQS